jgi:ethanolamine ammonia-lyase large subunit
MIEPHRRTHYTQQPDYIPAEIRAYGPARELTYRVVTVRGPIGAETFPNAWQALAWGHEHHRRGLWWVSAEIGVE